MKCFVVTKQSTTALIEEAFLKYPPFAIYLPCLAFLFVIMLVTIKLTFYGILEVHLHSSLYEIIIICHKVVWIHHMQSFVVFFSSSLNPNSKVLSSKNILLVFSFLSSISSYSFLVRVVAVVADNVWSEN